MPGENKVRHPEPSHGSHRRLAHCGALVPFPKSKFTFGPMMFDSYGNCRQLGFARAAITTERGETYLPWSEYGIRPENASSAQRAEIDALIATVNLVIREIEFEPRGSRGEPFVHIYTRSPYVLDFMNERRYLCEANNWSDIYGQLEDQDLFEELLVCHKTLEKRAEVFYYSVPLDKNGTLRGQCRGFQTYPETRAWRLQQEFVAVDLTESGGKAKLLSYDFASRSTSRLLPNTNEQSYEAQTTKIIDLAPPENKISRSEFILTCYSFPTT
ncbi:hypothetical protein GGR58DRAFT_527384 [Xylaria digitata]|nr:hypothetical protein GGR58DRAFT_527384 [Xylaria digitata]